MNHHRLRIVHDPDGSGEKSIWYEGNRIGYYTEENGLVYGIKRAGAELIGAADNDADIIKLITTWYERA